MNFASSDELKKDFDEQAKKYGLSRSKVLRILAEQFAKGNIQIEKSTQLKVKK